MTVWMTAAGAALGLGLTARCGRTAGIFSLTAGAGVLSRTAESALPALMDLGINVLKAAVVMFIGVRIAKFLRNMLNRTFTKMHMDSLLHSFLTAVVYAGVCGISAFIALEKLGVSSASIIALLGSAGLAVSLSMQDFLGNFAGGVIIMALKPFRAGDYIVCDTSEGIVAETGLFYTTLKTIDNRQIILPNGLVANARIINVTAEDKRRLEIRVSVAYEADLRRAKDILRRLFEENPNILHDEEIVTFIDELGESGITVVGRGWIAKENYWPTKWAMTEELKYAYDEAGIEIPVRRVSLDIRKEH